MKKIWLLLICLLTFFTVSASDQSNSLVDEAWVAWGKNNYRVVEEKLMAAFNSDKNDLRANISLTLFYQMKKNPIITLISFPSFQQISLFPTLIKVMKIW